MSSKVRILSSNSQNLQILEQQVEAKHREILQLRSEAQDLRRQQEAPPRNTLEVKIGMQPEHEHALARLERATALTRSFRTQILACLDCDLNDTKYIDAITTKESKQFWALLEQVKQSKAEIVMPKAEPSPVYTVQDAPPSTLTALLKEQCLALCNMAQKLKGSGHEDRLFQECTELYHKACTIE
ncbi:uncharacterized protein C8R40DRAFT_1074413 [Lentinula edodes]|uniref:uncharacterized protein n=1 Tax=Lentinula edodes TaxID=5353 RepID=UPI001E8DB249|nr:uncharacterized protein C8R40DRAFT_1074413 [Lentinula edodes]KAH7868921.1 hypothetical protein C8R40DRAFT_1074413 [Lentinula edodes]